MSTTSRGRQRSFGVGDIVAKSLDRISSRTGLSAGLLFSGGDISVGCLGRTF
jgi:hypothetical protein